MSDYPLDFIKRCCNEFNGFKAICNCAADAGSKTSLRSAPMLNRGIDSLPTPCKPDSIWLEMAYSLRVAVALNLSENKKATTYRLIEMMNSEYFRELYGRYPIIRCSTGKIIEQ